MFAYVGCYTTPDRDGRGEGIGVYHVDESTGAWRQVQLVAEVANPSFLILDRRGRTLYVVSGGDDYSDVSALAVDRATGSLTFVNRQSAGGRNPVHLSLDASGRFLAVASYNDGSVALLPVGIDGALGPLVDLVPQRGPHGPHPTEQAAPHPHHCPFDPAGRSIAVPDKGLDRVFVYRLDAERAKLVPGGGPGFIQTAPGAGPRHIAFHPGGRWAYVLNELDSTVGAYRWDADRATLEPTQVLTTLPAEFSGTNSGAEIAVAPSGRFVYASNRGHDSLAIFGVDDGSGELTALGWEPTRGRTPRFFGLDPAGRYLYAANQDSDTIVAFAVDAATGRLTHTGQTIETGSPACIAFLP
jgi:6-phosphogluconolactonase